MTVPSKSTLRYVAKQGYQLMLMRGTRTGTICGLHYLVMPQNAVEYGPRVRVYHGNPQTHTDIKIAKSWASFL